MARLSSRRQIAILFACNLIPWTIGNGLLPLMPVYAATLGAPPRLTGLIMAVAYAGLVAGTLAAGWVGDRWPHRKLLLVVAGVLVTPVTVGTGFVPGLSGFTVMLTLLWFLLGSQVGLVTALTGLHAAAARRGLSFGIVGIAPALGLLLGGVSAGALVDRFGFQGLFMAYAALALAAPLLALATTDGAAPHRPAMRATGATGATAVGLVGVVATALCLSGVATFFGVLVRSLAMHELLLPAAAISGTQAVTGVFALPLVLGLGWLSDRIGRERLLMLGPTAKTVGLLVLSFATGLWHFLLMSALWAFSQPTATLASAYVTDRVERRRLGRGLAVVVAAPWAGGIVGFGLGGLLIDGLGLTLTSLAGAALGLIAVGLLAGVTRSLPRRTA